MLQKKKEKKNATLAFSQPIANGFIWSISWSVFINFLNYALLKIIIYNILKFVLQKQKEKKNATLAFSQPIANGFIWSISWSVFINFLNYAYNMNFPLYIS